MPDVVDDPAWLIATSGFCSNLNVVMNERNVEASETEGDTAAHFMADGGQVHRFPSPPPHDHRGRRGRGGRAGLKRMGPQEHRAARLGRAARSTSTCGPEQGDQAWGISVFKVEEHRHCTDNETAWEGHPCVHYSGYVSAATSNFVNVNEGRFVRQLFVDSPCVTTGGDAVTRL